MIPCSHQPSSGDDDERRASNGQGIVAPVSDIARRPHLHLHHRHGRHDHHDPTGHDHAASEERQHRSRLSVDTGDLDSGKEQWKMMHRPSKSRDGRLPPPMIPLASSTRARSRLRGSQTSKEKERETDDGFLKPGITLDTTWSGTSSPGSRENSLTEDNTGGIMTVKRPGPMHRTVEDLDRKRWKRKMGEEYLRSTLSSIGTLATDLTRRLDYVYYNLLEKASALHATIDRFQELADSTSYLYKEFQRESTSVNYETRKQLEDLKGLENQVQTINALEKRMKAGRERVEELGKRLDTVKAEIDGWERREMEWQTRVSRRLRILWAVMGTVILIVVIATVVQSWPSPGPSEAETLSRMAMLMNQSLEVGTQHSDTFHQSHTRRDQDREKEWLQQHFHHRDTQQSDPYSGSSFAPTTTGKEKGPQDEDPLHIFDEL
ncbi:hypothetical protein Egran_03093 [Elaphomyces granulatus]|uniref:Uncharacterized protein n=1 Tax=Elaphomyces granulatus TaxID=519963 RepID=A0A232LYK3_9EURO|nr:hypothetical protein Egran_03093 [Elaphomyces granulatus]